MDNSKNSIFYVTKDRERAEGMLEKNGYSIISGDGSKDTLEILADSKIKAGGNILVFKNSKQIEDLVKEKGLKLLNPSSVLSERVENKITQVEWLGELKSFLPSHRIMLVKDIEWDIFSKKPFILQFAHSHTGGGTLLIKNEKELVKIKKEFPDRPARVTEYVDGPVFTANVALGKDKILVGNISYQITGLKPFTDNIFSTIGNDWSIPQNILTENQIGKFNKMAVAIAEKLRADGWKGLFGIDVIFDMKTESLFLIEINARQAASTTYESILQLKARENGALGITIFEAHILALTDAPLNKVFIVINDGAQIIQRVTKENAEKKIDTEKLKSLGYNVIEYKNTKINSDLLRIQSRLGIMETHNKFNKKGKEICHNVG